MPKWMSLRVAARLVGHHHRALTQRLERRNPMPHDFARDPDGQILEPRQVLVSLDTLRAEFPGKGLEKISPDSEISDISA